MLPLKLMIADDHSLFREGLISLMNTRPDLIQVMGEAGSGYEAIRMAKYLKPDVILMDIYMPDGNGLQAAQAIRQALPDTAIVILTSSETDQHLFEAVRIGAAGYLLKNLSANELFDLLIGIANGEAAITRAMASRLLRSIANHRIDDGTTDLSEREIEILRLIARGANNPQIAEKLFISVNTVKTHIRNILAKLNLENRTQVAAYAIQKGLVNPDGLF